MTVPSDTDSPSAGITTRVAPEEELAFGAGVGTEAAGGTGAGVGTGAT